MDKTELDNIQRRVDKATLGPWESVTVLPAKNYGDVRHPESPWRVIKGPPQVMPDYLTSRRAFERPEDGSFIAHSREDIPNLLRYVKDLQDLVQIHHDHYVKRFRNPYGGYTTYCLLCDTSAAVESHEGDCRMLKIVSLLG